MELLKELVRLCDALNSARIRYAVVGGCAVILHGYYRTTHDIDLVVDSSPKADFANPVPNKAKELTRWHT